MVLISGNDKSVPAHLVAIARCNLPAIHLPGGTQLNGPDYVTSDQMWALGAAVERGEMPREELERAQSVACPTCGACQFMGSASTGQVFAEALGLALPGSALIPAPLTRHLRYARAAGKQILKLIAEDITPRADPDPRRVRERDHAARGDRRLDQRAAAPAGDRPRGRHRHHAWTTSTASTAACRCWPTPRPPAATRSSTCGTRAACRR